MENFKSKNHTRSHKEILLTVLSSRFFYFLLGFLFLIIASNSYSPAQKRDKKPQAASIVETSTEEPEKTPSGSIQEKLVAQAVNQLGVKYTYAGKKPSTGFDCSGFTSYVYKQLGIEIPPSSITQSKVGEKITLDEAEKGDLIFFKSPTRGNNDIGHVGIVISSDSENVAFIHSSSNRGVVIDNLQSKHYKSRYRGIRRIL